MTVINATGAIQGADLSSMDVETALMTVQSRRAELLESQLKEQMQAVQDRNTQIEVLNTILAHARENRPTLSEKPDDADTTSKQITAGYLAYPVDAEDTVVLEVSALTPDQILAIQRLASSPNAPSWARAASQAIHDGDPTVEVWAGYLLDDYGIGRTGAADTGAMTQDEFDTMISNITAKIDSLNSTQQMDMLRLQSLTNKRNESFDVMTNFLKKMQESRSSIIGNLR